MPRTEARPFSLRNIWPQTNDLKTLVASNADWLPDSVYSGAYRRYNRCTLDAARQVARLALASGSLHPFVLYNQQSNERPEPVGIGTVIRSQAIAHPVMGQIVEGVDIDYWLDTQASENARLHRRTTDALIVWAKRLVERYDGHDALERTMFFATTVPGASHQPVGLTEVMQPFGEPSRLAIPITRDTSDPYGILKDGQTLQLYTLDPEIMG